MFRILSKKISLLGLLLIVSGAGFLIFLIQGQLSVYFIEKEMESNFALEMASFEIKEDTQSKEKNNHFQDIELTPAKSPKINSVGTPSAWKGLDDRPEVFARIRVPKIDLVAPVVHGVGEQQLSKAIGHFIYESVMPGEIGNTAYAGHNSNIDGAFFNRLHELKVNDQIIIDTLKYTYTYHVTDKFIVKPEDVWILEPFEDGKRTITLVTCESPENGGNQYRIIVRGVMQENE